MNIILFELIAWIIWMLVKKARIALWITILLSGLTGLVNHYVMAFRSTPFVPWDFYSIKTAASVAGEYDFTPDRNVIFVLFGMAVLLLAAFFVKREAAGSFPVRISAAVVLGIVLVVFAGRIQDESFQTRHRLYPFLFTPGVMVKYNGFAVTFAMDMAYMKVERPEGYQRDEAEKLLEGYENDLDTIWPKKEDLPNIIVIMDEAFSDLAVLGEFRTNTDYMPFVHSLQDGMENTITGNLTVSVCGGNTANSEFEFLTGHTMRFLPGGSIPYQQYIRNEIPNLVSWLKQAGYETWAQHPYHEGGWQRNKVYPLLGFDHMSFLPDYQAVQKVRSYVSDQTDFAMIRKTLQQKPAGKPLFLFNVTMQNHGGYTEVYDNFENTVLAEDLDCEPIDQYLSLLKLTDGELQKLLEDLSRFEEKTIVVFFGDHQPNDTIARPILAKNGISIRDMTEEQNELRYLVPYVIWANYDIEEASEADMRLSGLAAHLLKTAGIPLDPYQQFYLEYEKTQDAALEADYQLLQYYRLFDCQ